MPTLTASFRATILPVALALLFSGPRLSAQISQSSRGSQSSAANQSGTQYTFRENVNRVVVDVVVTDANGKAVHGLTQKDFSVSENGKPQDILSFDAYSLDSKPGYFRKLPPMPPNTFVNIATEPEKGPLYVLLLDLLNTEQDNQGYARQQLLKFIKGKPEGTRFAAFVLSDGLHLVQGFTADRDELYAALDPAHSRPHVPRIFLLGANYGRGDPLAVTFAIKQIALYLDGLPGRKNIFWFSGQFPLDLFPHNDDRPDTRDEAREALDALARSESSIYPIDVTGVDPSSPGLLTGSAPVQGTVAGTSGGSGATKPRPTSGSSLQNQTMTLANVGDSIYGNEAVSDVIAEMTGGQAYYSRNDLKDVLEEATETGSNYYTLTYSPSDQNFDGKMRRIQVQLAGADKSYHLAYRRGYLATASESPIMPVYTDRKHQQEALQDASNQRPIGDSLSAYMQRGAPIARDVIFRAHVSALSPAHLATPAQMANLVDQPTYFRVRQRKHPNKQLAPIKLQTYLIDYQIIARLPHLEVAAGVYDDEGLLLNGDVEEASSTNPTADNPRAKFTYFRVQQKIDVPVTAVSLRLGVRDVSTDRMGTMEIPLPLAPESSGSSPNSASASPQAKQETR